MSKPFDWLISTTNNPALRFIRAVFKSRPHVVAAEDVNRQFEALTEVSTEIQKTMGVIGRNVYLEFSAESFVDNGAGSYSIGVTATFKKVNTSLDAFIFSRGCRFPVTNNQAIVLGSTAFAKATEGLYLWLVATAEVIDFVADGELSGITTTNNSIVAGADTLVYTSYRFAFAKNEAGLSLGVGEEVVCILAGVRWETSGPKFYQTFLAPEKAFLDSTLELGGADVIEPENMGAMNIIQRMLEKLRQASLITRDITVTIPWANYEIGDTISQGTFLTDLIANAVEVAYAPETLPPLAVVSVSPSPQFAEVGEELTVAITGTFTQRQGGALSASELFYRNNSLGAVNSLPTQPVVISFGDNNFRYRATFGQGAMPVDLLGNEYPGIRIAAGIVDSANVNIKGVYPILFGVSATPGLVGVDIYADGTKILQEDSTLIEIPWPTDQKGVYLWFAVRVSDPIKTKWRNKFQPAGAGKIGDNGSLFRPAVSKAVTSSGLVTNWTQTYRLYVTALPTEGNTLIIE